MRFRDAVLFLRAGLTLLMVVLATACHEDAVRKQAERVDRAEFCTQGGAQLNQATNECLCSPDKKWTGARCENRMLPPPETTTAMVPMPAPPAAEAPAAIGKSEGAAPGSLTAEQKAELIQRCGKAHGSWLETEQYCQCPERQVLVGAACKRLRGYVTAEACARGVVPGQWKKGECWCDGTLTFVPGRGGCVTAAKNQVAIQKLSCESSLDLGQWDEHRGRCDCPVGRIWADELCWAQTRMSSALVCESDFNGGTWDWGQKRCHCPGGQLWINQTCAARAHFTARQVCESEWNRGHWSASHATCLCPEAMHWDATSEQCQRRRAH